MVKDWSSPKFYILFKNVQRLRIFGLAESEKMAVKETIVS